MGKKLYLITMTILPLVLGLLAGTVFVSYVSGNDEKMNPVFSFIMMVSGIYTGGYHAVELFKALKK